MKKLILPFQSTSASVSGDFRAAEQESLLEFVWKATLGWTT